MRLAGSSFLCDWSFFGRTYNISYIVSLSLCHRLILTPRDEFKNMQIAFFAGGGFTRLQLSDCRLRPESERLLDSHPHYRYDTPLPFHTLNSQLFQLLCCFLILSFHPITYQLIFRSRNRLRNWLLYQTNPLNHPNYFQLTQFPTTKSPTLYTPPFNWSLKALTLFLLTHYQSPTKSSTQTAKKLRIRAGIRSNQKIYYG